jgi:hypothetical protein
VNKNDKQEQPILLIFFCGVDERGEWVCTVEVLDSFLRLEGGGWNRERIVVYFLGFGEHSGRRKGKK